MSIVTASDEGEAQSKGDEGAISPHSFLYTQALALGRGRLASSRADPQNRAVTADTSAAWNLNDWNLLPLSTALKTGEQRFFAVASGPRPFKSFWLCLTEQGYRAFWNVCRHLPVPLDAGSMQADPGEELVCLTHGARFRTQDGFCLEGPCEGELLHSLELKEEAGKLWVKLSVPAQM